MFRLISTLLVVYSLMGSLVWAVPPKMIHPANRDLDLSRVDDALESDIAGRVVRGKASAPIRIIVGLYEPPSDEDVAVFENLGGVLTHRFEHAVYALAGSIPAKQVANLSKALGKKLCIIEYDSPGQADLDDSTRQARARPLVWDASNGYDLTGNPNTRIAICDSGIDDTHTDLAGRVVYWQDFTDDSNSSALDIYGHGTHIAGIAAGTGAQLGSSGNTSLTTTLTGHLDFQPGSGDGKNSNTGRSSTIKVPVDGSVQVSSTITWSGGSPVGMDLAEPGPVWQNYQWRYISPFTWSWTVANDLINHPYDIYYAAYAENESGIPKPYSMQTSYPYADVGDGFNLFQGMAPGCELVGLKMVENDGTTYASDWIATFNWLVQNNQTYKIKVANASVSSLSPSTTVRTAANTVVANGTVLVTSAGNQQVVTDPGLAKKVITVGAVNDFGAVTKYSANGPVGSGKPDVVAPGGSGSRYANNGSSVTSCETNDGDALGDLSDQNPDDYTNLAGTSMAAPHVAGLSALVIQAWENEGFTWDYSEQATLFVKAVILMTATETNLTGELNTPPLDRGSKDTLEGYGRINTDAAVEAIINKPPISNVQVALGPDRFERKCWSSQVALKAGITHDLTLAVPAGTDFDLYLYDMVPNPNGEPNLVQQSTTASSDDATNDEQISITPAADTNNFVVVKWVSGGGTFTLDHYVTVFVDDNAPNDPGWGDPTNSDPNENGSAEHPFDAVQEAIDVICGPGLAIVLDGTYTGTGNKNIDFGGKDITLRSENGPELTVIDCENSGRGFYFHSGETSESVVDGFAIVNGKVTGTNHGGGIFVSDSSPTIMNCRIMGNKAGYYGGGIHSYASDAVIVNCKIIGNSAEHAGGINLGIGSQRITNCVISDNSAAGVTGGIWCWHDCAATITNCIISGNSAGSGIGGIYCYGGSPTIVNSTISANASPAIYCFFSSSPTIVNCILWNEGAGEISIGDPANSHPTVSYSDVQGGWAGLGGNNIDADPCFADTNGPDGIPGTEDDDLHLSPGSACIDAGDNTAVGADADDLDGDGNTTEPTPWDFDDHPRFVDDPGIVDTGNGIPPIVDMGADEFPYLGDFKFDGCVKFLDYAILAAAWHSKPSDANWNSLCDIAEPKNNLIDELDLARFVANWLAGK